MGPHYLDLYWLEWQQPFTEPHFGSDTEDSTHNFCAELVSMTPPFTKRTEKNVEQQMESLVLPSLQKLM